MSVFENITFNNTFHSLGERFFSEVQPQGIKNPFLISASKPVAQLLGFDNDTVNSPEFVHYFSGNGLIPGSMPLAMIYSGHQFGSYNPQLGDGRALLLGEINSPNGRWDLNLKGAGLTPYSRSGDGRAVLRSSVREYLCSEAMHGLGIPTTRALCLIGGEDLIYREQVEPSATIIRVSKSHIRFGSFEYFFYQGMNDELQHLADYVIEHHYPEHKDKKDKYSLFLTDVIQRTALMIAKWQAFGFAHGVMNTDNMSILGQTFDYGPYGFIDDYEPGYICNHSDYTGRYAFDQQPQVGLWNLNALAHALSPLIPKEQIPSLLQQYQPAFLDHYLSLMRKKLGLNSELDEDPDFIKELLTVMAENAVDYTQFFRRLCDYSPESDKQSLQEMFKLDQDFIAWLAKYDQRLLNESTSFQERQQLMRSVNPKYILRNYLAQTAIDKAQNEADFSEVNQLLKLLYRPFDEQEEMERYAAPPPTWGKKMEISCSS